MAQYRKTSHSVYDCTYHIAWITKYRYAVLTGQAAVRVRELIRQICNANEVEILSGSVSSDHVHLHVSIPPQHSVSKIVQFLKGATSRKLQLEFEGLRKRYWGQHIWARGYFVATTGVVSQEQIQNYIHGQTEGGQDEDFKITSL